MDWIKIILVETSHPGNIGSIARAMKTMGFSKLRLVNPRQFPHKEAYSLATHAHDILDKAECFTDLPSAISDCQYVFMTSSRQRKHPLPVITPRQLTEDLIASPQTTAIVFGNEQSGLSNDLINLGQRQVIIPTSPDYSVLNIAQACQIILYELQFINNQKPEKIITEPMPTQKELSILFDHISQALIALKLNNPKSPKSAMRILQQIVNRSQPTVRELGLLNGVFSSINKSINN